MKDFRGTIAAAMVALTLVISAAAPFSAQASEAGRKNTTLAIGALTGVLAAKKMWIPAAVAGVGTYAAYHNWQAQIDHRHRTQSRLAELHAYHAGLARARAERARHYAASVRHHRRHHRA